MRLLLLCLPLLILGLGLRGPGSQPATTADEGGHRPESAALESAQDSEAPQGEPLVISQVAGSVDALAGRAVLEEAYERLGLEVSFELVPPDESRDALDSGRFAAELQRIDGAQRSYPQLIQVPIPINYIQGAAFSSQYDFPIRGWHSLRPYRIGIVEGIIFAQEGTQGMEVKQAESYDELLEWIDKGVVDVGVMPRVNGLHALRSSGREGIKEMRGVLQTVLLYHYVHESHPELVPLLRPVLKEMLLEGTTRRLCEQASAELQGEDD